MSYQRVAFYFIYLLNMLPVSLFRRTTIVLVSVLSGAMASAAMAHVKMRVDPFDEAQAAGIVVLTFQLLPLNE